MGSLSHGKNIFDYKGGQTRLTGWRVEYTFDDLSERGGPVDRTRDFTNQLELIEFMNKNPYMGSIVIQKVYEVQVTTVTKNCSDSAWQEVQKAADAQMAERDKEAEEAEIAEMEAKLKERKDMFSKKFG